MQKRRVFEQFCLILRNFMRNLSRKIADVELNNVVVFAEKTKMLSQRAISSAKKACFRPTLLDFDRKLSRKIAGVELNIVIIFAENEKI